MTEFGTITVEGTTRTLRFERVLEHPPEEVWAALTEPERLRDWLAPAEVDPGPGGTITLDFGDGGIENCRITAWDPPRLLQYEWTSSARRRPTSAGSSPSSLTAPRPG